MARQTLPTRALLACGAVAGPLYVTVTMAQALTRDGFDLRQHRFTLLTSGDLGWIHQSNMLLVGVLTVLLAVGVRQILRTGRGAVWGPRLLGMFGVAYIVGGMLRADPVAGFPPGTTPEMVQTTWQGAVQNASRGVSSLLLIATSGVIAGWFAAEGRRVWAWFYGAAIPMVFVALTAVGFASAVTQIHGVAMKARRSPRCACSARARSTISSTAASRGAGSSAWRRSPPPVRSCRSAPSVRSRSSPTRERSPTTR